MNSDVTSRTAAVWRLSSLPDFLKDPSLAATHETERLAEYLQGWVQLISALSPWQDRATFALHIRAEPGAATIDFIGVADQESYLFRLADELSVLLRVHKLIRSNSRPEVYPVSEARERVLLDGAELVGVRQFQTRQLFKARGAIPADLKGVVSRFSKEDTDSPPVVFMWHGPSGPFLHPMEALISQSAPCAMMVLLRPTRLRVHERDFLAVMAQIAQTQGEQSLAAIGQSSAVRRVDPIASMVGRLYSAALQRLLVSPFLGGVVCACELNSRSSPRSIAGTLEAMVHSVWHNEVDLQSGGQPSATQCYPDDASVNPQAEIDELKSVYYNMTFPRFDDNSSDLGRLPYLMDARGAASVFRLPVSVRGGVPGVSVRQSAPDFHPGPRVLAKSGTEVHLGDFEVGGMASIELPELTKHALVTGFTGSGKTHTVLNILHQLWVDHGVPVLVLESAKQEYRALTLVKAFSARSPRLRVYTAGNENCAPIRINPFQLLPGVRVEAHIGRLQSCLEAAIPPVGPSSSVIAESLVETYLGFGWTLTDEYPRNRAMSREFPTLEDFVENIEKVLESRAYEGEIKANLRAALVGRFRPLLIGGKGRMFVTPVCAPAPDVLFKHPVIIEMNDLVVEDKAFLTMVLLTLLREYRELERGRPGIQHVTIVEEAHNVLENVEGESAGEGATKSDVRRKAVEAFCALLTEIRALGEGLVIADQSPEKLAPDALRNTNLQIAHQIRDAQDREAIARAMIMEDEQREFLGKLAPGRAAIFKTGMEKAAFVVVPEYWREGQPGLRGDGFVSYLSDEHVRTLMDKIDPEMPQRRSPVLPYLGCQSCTNMCLFRDGVFAVASQPEWSQRGEAWFSLTSPAEQSRLGIPTEEVWSRGVALARSIADAAYPGADIDASWCALVHLYGIQLRRTEWSEQADGLDSACRKRFDSVWSRSSAVPPK